jgi:hypothetical protein
MHSHRTTARGVTFLLLLWVLAGSANAGAARGKGVPDLLFPVVGSVDYRDDFGEARGQGRHEGNDILGDRRAPVVAVEDGKVRFWTTSSRAGCMLYLYGKSGTTYLYIHLNNDLGNRNDNKGSCTAGVAYAPGLGDGDRVRAGQLIAYLGDSGDANGIHPHLHFEVHPNDGGAVSPFSYLRKATPLLFARPAPGDPLTLALYGTVEQVAGNQLVLKLVKVRGSDGTRTAISRDLSITVPAGTPVERTSTDGRRGAALASSAPGESVVVWTTEVPATLDAQTGAPGVIVAARILYRGA